MDLVRALAEWRAALGDAHVLQDGDVRRLHETATFATSSRVPVVLRPGSRQDVQACLRVAQACGVPVHPLSAGRNIGYGGRVPGADGAVMDLRRMDRVVAYDDRLGTLTVQPGVTFAAAHAFLRERRARFFLAATGGPPAASLVGNLVERGDGVGPHGDVFAHACNLEVVLPTGQCIRTGYGRAPGSVVHAAARYGVGPFVDGLFTQSNLGVVTEATFRLARLPACLLGWMATLSDEERLGPAVDVLRELRMDGTQRTPVFLWDRGKALATLGQYPYALAGGRTPLPPALLDSLSAQAGLGRWMVTGAFHGADAAQVEACRARVASELGPRVDSLVFSPPLENPAEHPLAGAPSADNLRMLWWRRRTPPGDLAEPEAEDCGFAWACVVAPFTGEHVAEVTRLARDVVEIHGFESNLALISMEETSLYVLCALAWDRSAPGEDARGRACHDALMREWSAAGFPPLRLGVQSMEFFPALSGDDADFLRRLRDVMDPAHVLSPGRYEPPRGK